VLLQNSHGDFSSKQNTVFLYQKFKIVISDDQDCVISDDRSQRLQPLLLPEQKREHILSYLHYLFSFLV